MPSRRTSPRRKPLWRWEPFWYIALFVTIFVTSALQATGAWVAFIIFLSLACLIALALIAQIIVGALRAPGNPDASGNVSTLAGLTLVPANSSTANSSTAKENAEKSSIVADTKRHQSAIDAASAFGGQHLLALLVPGSTRWLGRRLRIAVHLIAGERVFHAGFVPAELDGELDRLLAPLRGRGEFVQVAAVILGERRPFEVAIDLAAVHTAANIANAQQASS